MARLGDPTQPLGAEQGHVDGRCGDGEPLIGTDVRGRLRTPDVLFARLQSQGESRAAVQIDRSSCNTSGHLPHVLGLASEKPEIGTAAGEWNAEWWSVARRDVGAARAPLPGRYEQP